MGADDITGILDGLRVGSTASFDNPHSDRDDEATMTVERRADGFYGDNGKFDFDAPTSAAAAAKLSRWGYVIHATSSCGPRR